MDAINRNVKYGDVVWVRGADTKVRQVTVLGGVTKSPDLFLHFGRVIPNGAEISSVTEYEVMSRIHITHPPQPAYKDSTAGAEAIRMQAHEIAALQQKIRELETQIVRGQEREKALDYALEQVKGLIRTSPRLDALQMLADEQQRAQEAAGTFGLHLRSTRPQSAVLYRCDREACPGSVFVHVPDGCPGAPGNPALGDPFRGR